jgi:uncharacterized protein (TIGR03435 family)
MKQIMLCCSFLVLLRGNSVAQGQENRPTFEVASVKPAILHPGDPPGRDCTGGPGTSDPAYLKCSCSPLAAVVARAYNINFTDLRGPDWVFWTQNCYDINAKVPPGTSKEQFQLMLQNLLSDRFHLSVHRETKILPSYALSLGRAGPKFRAHPSTPPSEGSSPDPRNSGSLPTVGQRGSLIWVGTNLRLTANDSDMKSVARLLMRVMQAPVVDETGLDGRYDFVLNFAAPEFITGGHSNSRKDEEALPQIFTALQEELGLNLTMKKVPRDLLVVDRAQGAHRELSYFPGAKYPRVAPNGTCPASDNPITPPMSAGNWRVIVSW